VFVIAVVVVVGCGGGGHCAAQKILDCPAYGASFLFAPQKWWWSVNYSPKRLKLAVDSKKVKTKKSLDMKVTKGKSMDLKECFFGCIWWKT